MKKYILVSVLLSLLLSPAVFAEDHPGQAVFSRCAACHLAEGQGIPGAFPPISGRIAQIAALDGGRAYLVAVVHAGLMGQISVNGMSYFGAMPAQGASFDAEGISDVLNYAIEILDKDLVEAEWQSYTTEEVARLTSGDAPSNGQAVAKLRATLAQDHPELF